MACAAEEGKMNHPSNTLMPIFEHQSPYTIVLNRMSEELIEHIRWFGPDEDGKIRQFYLVEGYQQMIVDFAIAVIRIAKLHQQYQLSRRSLQYRDLEEVTGHGRY